MPIISVHKKLGWEEQRFQPTSKASSGKLIILIILKFERKMAEVILTISFTHDFLAKERKSLGPGVPLLCSWQNKEGNGLEY